MSMISAQCDRLRERAKVLRQGRWSDGADDAKMLDDAADTIWELRCKLAGMVDERERARVAEAENAKLRELVEDMLDYIEIREAFGRPPTSEMCKEFAQRADKLGIEVE